MKLKILASVCGTLCQVAVVRLLQFHNSLIQLNVLLSPFYDNNRHNRKMQFNFHFRLQLWTVSITNRFNFNWKLIGIASISLYTKVYGHNSILKRKRNRIESSKIAIGDLN